MTLNFLLDIPSSLNKSLLITLIYTREDYIIVTREAISKRIIGLCKANSLSVYGLSIASAVPESTIRSILNGTSNNPGVITIKKLCDGFNITLYEFFMTDDFNNLEQEII